MPAVAESSRRSDVDEVVAYLQRAGQRYHEHVALLREEQQLREAQHAPFKPTITPYADEVGKSSVVRHESSIGSRLHELHEKKLALVAEEAAEEEKRRIAADAQACSFAPTLTARAEHAKRRDGTDVSTTLHRWEERRRARQARAQVEAVRQDLRRATGVPRISAYAEEKARMERRDGTAAAVPIEESLLAAATERRQRQYRDYEKQRGSGGAGASGSVRRGLSSSRASAEDSPCFAPAISAYAAQIRFSEDVVERLYSHHHGAQQHEQRRSQSRSRRHQTSSQLSRSPSSEAACHRSRGSPPRPGVYDEEVTLHCTFQPKLSARSTELSRLYYDEEKSANAGESTEDDPFARLYRNAHHPSKYRKAALDADASLGQPEISAASRRMVEERRRQLALDGQPGALGNSPGSRLYPDPHRATASTSPPRPTFKKRVVTARDVEAQNGFRFAPSVSSASEALWRDRVTSLKASGAARTTDEARQLLWRKAERRREEEVSKLQDQRRRQEAAECTFHPKAGRPPQRRSGYAAMPIEARTSLWAQQRDARLFELRSELDGTQLVECSFHPHVDPVFPLPRADARVAAGVETFLERQAAARRLREEAEEWWRPQYARKSRQRAANVSPSSSLSRPPARVHHDDSEVEGMQSMEAEEEASHLTAHTASPMRRSDTNASGPRRGRDVDESHPPPHQEGRRRDAPDSGQEGRDEEEEVFVQHWTRQPPSTSLTASSFSQESQQDVPSAESSSAQPPRPAYVVQQPPAHVDGQASRASPYMWRRRPSVDTARSSPPAWRKPLQYRPVASSAAASHARPGRLDAHLR